MNTDLMYDSDTDFAQEFQSSQENQNRSPWVSRKK